MSGNAIIIFIWGRRWKYKGLNFFEGHCSKLKILKIIQFLTLALIQFFMMGQTFGIKLMKIAHYTLCIHLLLKILKMIINKQKQNTEEKSSSLILKEKYLWGSISSRKKPLYWFKIFKKFYRNIIN